MNAAPSYAPRLVNGPKRRRRTKAEIAEIHDAIVAILDSDHPQTVRHVFYRLCSQPWSLVDKTEAGYQTVKTQLLKLRKAGAIPWVWLADNTRWMRKARTFQSAADAVRWCAETYRRDLWTRSPAYVEIWCESDSIAGVLAREANAYGVPLMVSRGFASWTFLYSAAEAIKTAGKPAHLYYVGDWDPSGKLIPENIERTLRGFADDADIRFQRLLVTPTQIVEWRLPTKPAKRSTHASQFKGGTVEAEAVPASVTRRLVREAIEAHIDPAEMQVMEVAEASEREWLSAIADRMEADNGR